MAPSTKRSKGREITKRVRQNPYSRPWCCKCHCEGTRPRSRKDTDIQELVYQLLNVEKHNQGRKRKWPPSRKRRIPRERSERYRDSHICPYEAVSISRGSSECEAASTENLTETTDAASSSVTQSSINGDLSNSFVEAIRPDSVDDTRALLNKRSIVQIINNYIKAGIEEGKRQAKMYIRKALCFGVKSGYLIPADPEGQVLKVSSTLVSSRRTDAESRKRRRQVRKGEENVAKSIQQKNPSWNIRTSHDENIDSTPGGITGRPKRKVTKRNVKSTKSKDSIGNSIQDDGERPKRGRKKRTRTGKVQKKRTRRNRTSKELTKRSRTSSKSPSNCEVKTDHDLDDRNWSDNEEKCHSLRKAKDGLSESIECPSSKHRPFATNGEESREEEMEGVRRENNDEMKDSVEESNEVDPPELEVDVTQDFAGIHCTERASHLWNLSGTLLPRSLFRGSKTIEFSSTEIIPVILDKRSKERV
ncbi:hypothetical protein KPH14_007714 [Odynerus spinipes]|uniref:Uncharacterized protein n=1 Tax=Odynerus spinipes TaxID=1348599 RepID=A0AAD9VNU1_9HYME|nr:hypothetical protein KPH14_007714 [Odynerus spinipes]